MIFHIKNRDLIRGIKHLHVSQCKHVHGDHCCNTRICHITEKETRKEWQP